MDEQWTANFIKVQEFYQKHKHHSLRSKTLLQWLTYQRLHAKTLSERQIQLLESISYKNASGSGFRGCDEEVWESKLAALKHLENHGYPGKRGKHSRTIKLAPEKRKRLEEIGIDFSAYKANQKQKKIAMDTWTHGTNNLRN
jgi:hypothetical protein